MCTCERCVDPKEGGLESGTVGCPECRKRVGEGWGEEKGGEGGAGGEGGGGGFAPMRPMKGGGGRRRRSESESDSKQKQQQRQQQHQNDDDEDDPSRPLLGPFKSSSSSSSSSLPSSSSSSSSSFSSSSSSYYQCENCHTCIPSTQVLDLERRFQTELKRILHQGGRGGGREGGIGSYSDEGQEGGREGGVCLRTARQVNDYETLICLFSGRGLHPRHWLLQEARMGLFEGVCRMVGEAKERLGRMMMMEGGEEEEGEEEDVEGMEEGRRGGLRISGKSGRRRVDERRERKERRKGEALLQWSEWDARLIALASVLVSYIQTTHQTLDEQSTALILGEWALAAHRQAYRRREDVGGLEGGREGGYGLEEGPRKREMQLEAKRLLKKAEECLSTSQGAYFRRHILLEQEVREALSAKDPAAELLLMGGRKREIVMPTSLTEPDEEGDQRLMHMATHAAAMGRRGGGCEGGGEGGREEQFEAIVQMALAGQEERSQAVRDMWVGETEKARLDLKSPEAAGAVSSILEGGGARVALPAAAAAGAAGAVPARRRVAPAGKSKVE